MDEQLGSFREMNERSFTKTKPKKTNDIWNKLFKNESFFTEPERFFQTNFLKTFIQ